MTREEAIKLVKEVTGMSLDWDDAHYEALQMAIGALEAEPCEDAISRKSVDTLVDELARAISDERLRIPRGRSTGEIMQDILDLPSVTPKQKTGIVRCKNCSYFEYDHLMNIDGVPLIVAHEFCTRWGDGCKTSENGFCFLGKEKEVNK